ncbi:MAG: hypothetical protein RMI01_08070 [Thermodesulfovibrio sp.]|nr:hypothetical protein [Thermodesulfovibrio sp.]
MKNKISTLVYIFLVSFFISSYAEAKIQCIDSEGQAAILNNDIPAAKAEAISRAKWDAIEKVAGVKVKAQTVVQNFTLVDDAVIKHTRGVISNYKLRKEWKEGDIYKVIMNVCVESTKADDAVSKLALNNSVAVFIPARKPKILKEREEILREPHSKSEYHYLKTKDEYEETNILSETIIGSLTERGVTVVDVIPTNIADASMIENAMKTGNYMSLRSIMYKTLSNLLVIGKVDYTISTRKGQDIGYGLTMPVNNVTTRLTYRVVAKEKDSDRVIIVAAGTEEAKGMALNLEDATAQSMKNLAEKFVPVLFEKINKYIQGFTKRVTIKVTNVDNISRNFEIKEILQNIAWVTEVEEKGLGEFFVGYPENTVYLANSLNQKGFEIINFSKYEITLKYRKILQE